MAHQVEGARPSAPPFAGAWPAALVIGLTLLIISVARYSGFARPHYAAALVFQTGVLLLLLLGAFPWRNRSQPCRRTFAAWLFAMYACCCVLSWYWAPEGFRRLSAIGSITAVQGVLWALLVSRLVRDARSLQWLLRAAVAAGTLAALAGIFYVAGYHSPGHPPPWIRVFSEGVASLNEEFRVALDHAEQVQGHRNFLAIFLLPPLLICLSELLAKPLTRGASARGFMGWPVWLSLSVMAPMLLALALCKSWGSLVGAGAGAACLLAMRLSRRWRLALLASALVLGFLIIGALASSSVQQWMVNKSQGTRLFMWKGVARMIQERPLLGWGTGMFMPFFPDYKPTEPMRYGWLSAQTIYPHDELLLVGVEVGLLGLMLYLAGHLLAVGGVLRRDGAAQDPALRLAGWAILAGVLAMFLHGLVEIALRFWAPAAMYWTMVGLLMALPCIIQPPEAPRKPPNRIVGVAGFGLAIVIAAVMGRWLIGGGARSEWLMGPASRNLSVERYAEAELEAARCSRYIPDTLEALGFRARVLGRVNRLPEAIEAYQTLYAVSPGFLTREGSARYQLGALYLKQALALDATDVKFAAESLSQARRFCGEAIAQNPHDASSRMLMSNILLKESGRNLPQAIEQLQQGAAAWNATAWTHYRLATLLAAAGRRDEALAALERAQKMAKKDEPLAKDIESLRKRLATP